MPSLATTVALVGSILPAVLAQGVPLASKSFQWANLPYQADTDDGERGRQSGYNLCNSTTEGQESMCQTAIINSIDDFCLWGPPDPDSLIGDVEGESVAWCTKPGYGARTIPAGALTGVQFIKTPDYVQVTGWITQQYINIEKDDSGGELDPHGADQRGNPLGGLLFSTAWGNGYTQAVEWHNFMGGGTFCLKACDPAGPDAARFCEHIFDRIGCYYNAPGKYEEGTFESCLGENQDFPGIYTGADGATSTYTQPPESLGPITVTPYTPRIPASSSCTPFDPSGWTDAVAATGVVTPPTGTRSTTRSAGSSTRTGSSTRSAATSDTPDAGFLGASPATAGWLAGLAAFAAVLL